MKRTIVMFGLVAFVFAAAAAAAEAPAVDPEGLEATSSVAATTAPGAGPSALARLASFAAGSFAGAGAPFMWAILFVSAFSVTVVAEKAVFLYLKATKGDRDTFEHVIRLVRDRRIEEARTVADRSKTPFARIAASVLRVRHGHRSEELQNLMDEAYLREVPAIGRRIPLLAVSANLATLLGLLGTIVGLIMAFDAVANVPAAQRTAALAAGISVAMATTGFGLVVAIPTLAAHGLLGSRSDRVTEEIESRLAVIANLVHEWNRKTQADPYEESKTGIAERRERLVDYVSAGEIG